MLRVLLGARVGPVLWQTLLICLLLLQRGFSLPSASPDRLRTKGLSCLCGELRTSLTSSFFVADNVDIVVSFADRLMRLLRNNFQYLGLVDKILLLQTWRE